VEICASIYQSQLMQNSTSYLSTAAIIGIDVIHGIVSVKMFMDKTNAAVPRNQIISTALHRIRNNSGGSVYPTQPPLGAGRKSVSVTSLNSPSEKQRRDGDNSVVQDALEIAQAAESILLIEYFEVAIPIMNGIFITVAAQLDSARYNPNARSFYHHIDRLESAMTSLMVYSVLQGLSLVAMSGVMWYRYRLSAMTQLAFILEHHRDSIQGKICSWLALFFNFMIMHYGTTLHSGVNWLWSDR
jgi:hypothetical protein